MLCNSQCVLSRNTISAVMKEGEPILHFLKDDPGSGFVHEDSRCSSWYRFNSMTICMCSYTIIGHPFFVSSGDNDVLFFLNISYIFHFLTYSSHVWILMLLASHVLFYYILLYNLSFSYLIEVKLLKRIHLNSTYTKTAVPAHLPFISPKPFFTPLLRGLS